MCFFDSSDKQQYLPQNSQIRHCLSCWWQGVGHRAEEMARMPWNVEMAAFRAEWALAAIHTQPHTWACPRSHLTALQSCRTGHAAPEGRDIHWDNLLASLFLWAQSPAAEQEVWEGCVRGRKPASEPAPGATELQAAAC